MKMDHLIGIRPNRADGFTLIELIVTFAIIGILSGTTIPAYKTYGKKAKVAQAMSDLKTIQLAIETLAIDTEKWPGGRDVGEINIGPNNEVWDLNAPSAGLVVTDGGFPDWDGPYIQSVPQDPWGSNYFFDPDYRINGEDFVVIGCFGPNKVGPNAYDSDDVILILPAN